MLAMKKLILILAVVAFATTAWAQETPKKPSFAGFVSNGFWDNWFISIGAGGQVYFGEYDSKDDFGRRITPTFDFSVGK